MTTLWDNIKKGLMDSAKMAKEGAQIAAEKAEELGKKSKIMLDISNIKRKIEKQFTELGGKVYHEMHEESVTDFAANEDVKSIVAGIKALEEELRAKQDELEQVGKVTEDDTVQEGEVSSAEEAPAEETPKEE